MSQLARQVFGLLTPDEGALFDIALAFHIAAGLTCVITGALAATTPKRPGRHTLSGRIFFCPWPWCSPPRPPWPSCASSRTGTSW